MSPIKALGEDNRKALEQSDSDAIEAGDLDALGWCSLARRVDSPHFDARPAKMPVSLVVIHAISLPPGEFGGPAVEALFTKTLDPKAHPYFETIVSLRVSAHFFIRRDGTMIQFVSCYDRAWHAGVSSWQGRSGCNDFSIGIELEGTDDSPFEPCQYKALIRVLKILKLYFPLTGIVGHSDIAPERKTDPGTGFDWAALEALSVKLR